MGNTGRKHWLKSPWCYISTSVGICMSLIDERPVFLNIIAAELEYEDAKDINKERDLEEIRKILIQHIPHLTDGGLLFEPEEAVEMHKGAVDMMKKNENLSVLTTYADVELYRKLRMIIHLILLIRLLRIFMPKLVQVVNSLAQILIYR